jgi:hypothetical protein
MKFVTDAKSKCFPKAILGNMTDANQPAERRRIKLMCKIKLNIGVAVYEYGYVI